MTTARHRGPATGAYVFQSSCNLPTDIGVFELRVYRNTTTGVEAIVMVARVWHGRYKGPMAADVSVSDRVTRAVVEAAPGTGGRTVVMRVHDQCQTSEIFGSVKCDCKRQLDRALLHIQTLARLTYRHRVRSTAATRMANPAEHDSGAGAGVMPALLAGEHDRAASGLPSRHTNATGTAPAPSMGGDSGSAGDSSASSPSPAAGDGCGCAGHGDDVVGLVIYLQQEGRGIGLAAKVSAYALQERPDGAWDGFEMEEGVDGMGGGHPHPATTPSTSPTGARGLDTVDANRALGLPDDSREYGAVVDVLTDLGIMAASPATGLAPCIAGLHLFSNNPRKLEQLVALGVPVTGTVACTVPPPSPLAAAYMRTKAERMGHAIPLTVYDHGHPTV